VRVVTNKSDYKLNVEGFYCPELVQYLKSYGLTYTWKRLSENERQNNFSVGDLVFIEKSESHPSGHFLVKSAEGWMDPWINLDHNNINIGTATSGFRDELPGQAEYLIYQAKD
jgi:hypothetical protein